MGSLKRHSERFESEGAHNLWPTLVSPVESLKDELFDKSDLEVYIKRDDLLHPYGGNKWRKLKYNFLQMSKEGYNEFLTFGGPFSNHVFACATLAREHDLAATLFIRGSIDDLENPVLMHARKCGVKLVAVERRAYAKRYSSKFKVELKATYPSAFIIPEGGANQNGIQGCGEIVSETLEQMTSRPDVWIVGAGTANTAVGIASQLSGSEKVIAIAALRERIMQQAFQNSLGMIAESARQCLSLSDDYSFGGMAKWNKELLGFIQKFEISNKILLDPVYTGKAMYALFDMAAKGFFKRGSRIVFVHTGGMPGRMSFNYRFGELLIVPGL